MNAAQTRESSATLSKKPNGREKVLKLIDDVKYIDGDTIFVALRGRRIEVRALLRDRVSMQVLRTKLNKLETQTAINFQPRISSSDVTLSKQKAKRLQRHINSFFLNSNIRVKAMVDTIKLTGQVSDLVKVSICEKLASDFPGVSKVINQIKVA